MKATPSPNALGATRGQVFLSYAREDKAVARAIADQLQVDGWSVWADWSSIPPTAEWWEQIVAAIASSTVFAFVISEASARSEACAREVDEAVRTSKRLVPIEHRPVDAKSLPPAIAARQWVPVTAIEGAPVDVSAIVAALNLDLDWLRSHTWLATRARDWLRQGHDPSFELRGAELRDAELLFESAAPHLGRGLSQEQIAFLLASRRSATLRQRKQIAWVTAALVVSLVLTALALVFYFTAEDRRSQTRAQLLSVHASQAAQEDQPQRALLLAIEGVRERFDRGEQPPVDVLNELYRRVVAVGGDPVGATHGAVNTVVLDGSGTLISAGADGDLWLWTVDNGGRWKHHRTSSKHERGVLALAGDSSRQFLLSTGGDHSVSLWELGSDRDPIHVAKLARHTERVIAADHFSNGVFSASWDGRVRLYRRSGRTVTPDRTLDRGKEHALTHAAVSPDGRWAVGGYGDGAIAVWDLRTEGVAPRHVLTIHTSTVSQVGFSPDGRWLASGALDRRVALIRTDELELESPRWDQLIGHEAQISRLAFSPDSNWLATGSDDFTVRLWPLPYDGSRKPHVLSGHTAEIRQLVFGTGAAARWLASAAKDRTVRLWDLNAVDQDPAVLRGHDDVVSALSFAPDGARLYTASDDSTLRAWKLDSEDPGAARVPRVLARLRDSIRHIEVSRDGERVMSADEGGLVCTWRAGDPSSPVCLQTDTTGRRPHPVALAPDLPGFVAGDRRGRVKFCRQAPAASSFTCDERAAHQGYVARVAVDRKGTVAASGGGDGTVVLWRRDLDGGFSDLSLAPHARFISALEIDEAGSRLCSGSQDGTTRLWRVERGNRVIRHDLEKHRQLVSHCAFSPDGRWLVTAGTEDTAWLWNLRAESVESSAQALKGHRNEPLPLGITSVAFGGTSGEVFTSGVDSTVRRWDALKPNPSLDHRQLLGHHQGTFGHGVKSLAVSPAGRWLASAGEDGAVRMWDLDAENPALGSVLLAGHTHSVMSAQFSPDGRTLYSGGSDRDPTVREWPVDVKELLRASCAELPRNLSNAEWKRYFGDEVRRATCPNLPLD